MKWDKLFYANAALVCSFVATILVPPSAPTIVAITSLQKLFLLKYATYRALVFFLVSKCLLVNYVILKLLESVAPKRTARRVRRIASTVVQCSAVTFVNVTSAYIFKVNMEVLLRRLVLVVVSIYGMAGASLLQMDVLAFFFHCCVLSGNVVIFCSTFLSDFSALYKFFVPYYLDLMAFGH